MKAIIIGSGIAGLATAVRLSSKGWEVDVYESNHFVGGKLSEFTIDGFRFDRGPSLFTMPHLVDDLFHQAGKNPKASFNYTQLDELCRYFYEDGIQFIARADERAFVEDAAKTFHVDAQRLKTHLKRSKTIYDQLGSLFMEMSLHRIKNFFQWPTLRAIVNIPRLGLFGKLNDYHEKHIAEPHLVQYFNRYATYNGSNPFAAPATLHIIPHLEHHMGAYFPEKGMYRITESIFLLAKELGVNFHLNAPVEEILVRDGIAIGVSVNGAEKLADKVISNMDVYHTYKRLLPRENHPTKLLNQEKSSSALVFYWGIKRKYEELGLHNILFSADYKREFEGIFDAHTIYSDPTVYINITSKLHEDDAPAGMENWFVMINVPHNNGEDWEALCKEARQSIISKINRLLNTNIEEEIAVEDYWTPAGIESMTSSFKGALYGNASNNKMAAFLRHANFSSEIEHLYFCGGSVHPGGGIPLALLSGKIVADLILEEK